MRFMVLPRNLIVNCDNKGLTGISIVARAGGGKQDDQILNFSRVFYSVSGVNQMAVCSERRRQPESNLDLACRLVPPRYTWQAAQIRPLNEDFNVVS